MSAKITESLQAALPLWEKANTLKPGERRTLETLQYIYVQLGQNEKAADIGKQLESMPEG